MCSGVASAPKGAERESLALMLLLCCLLASPSACGSSKQTHWGVVYVVLAVNCPVNAATAQ